MQKPSFPGANVHEVPSFVHSRGGASALRSPGQATSRSETKAIVGRRAGIAPCYALPRRPPLLLANDHCLVKTTSSFFELLYMWSVVPITVYESSPPRCTPTIDAGQKPLRSMLPVAPLVVKANAP